MKVPPPADGRPGNPQYLVRVLLAYKNARVQTNRFHGWVLVAWTDELGKYHLEWFNRAW